MREQVIEKYLTKSVVAMGGRCYKWVSPGNVGVPDRIVVLPGNTVLMVEVKASGKLPTSIQRYQHGILKALGVAVYIVDSVEAVDRLLEGFVS